jgi:hypothetical protein
MLGLLLLAVSIALCPLLFPTVGCDRCIEVPAAVSAHRWPGVGFGSGQDFAIGWCFVLTQHMTLLFHCCLHVHLDVEVDTLRTELSLLPTKRGTNTLHNSARVPVIVAKQVRWVY